MAIEMYENMSDIEERSLSSDRNTDEGACLNEPGDGAIEKN